MNLVKSYFLKAHKFLWQNKLFYFYGLVVSLLNAIPTILISNSFDPWGLMTIASMIFGYFWFAYLVLLPVFFYRIIKKEELSILQILLISLKKIKDLFVIVSAILLLFIPLIILFYLIFDVSLQIKLVEQAFVDTTKIQGFVFYPWGAAFWLIINLTSAVVYLVPILYILEKQTIWASIKRSIYIFIKNPVFLLSVSSLYATYYAVSFLFIPTGNYYLSPVKSLIEVFITLISTLVVVLFYKDNYKIQVKQNKISNKVEEKKPHRIARWILAIIFVLFIELILIFIYTSASEYFGFKPENETAAVTLVAIMFLMPFLAYLLLRNRSVTAIIFWLIGAIVSGFITFGVLVYHEVQKEQQEPSAANSQLSSSKLLQAINKKRKENNVRPLAFEPSTCSLAKLRVNEVVKRGIGIYGNSASFQRAIDRTFREDRSLDIEKAPDWYNEYLTYEETVEDSITMWESGDAKLLFNDKQYQYACVAEKNGFAIIIVSFYNSPESKENITGNEDINSPLDYESNEDYIDTNATFL